MKNLDISFIQSNLFWESTDLNLEHFDSLIDKINVESQIIILPEMFNTAFSINPEKCAETIDGKTINWMKHQASKKNAVIAGSLLINQNSRYYNRFIWMQPDGNYQYYDKRHLFRMSDEFKIFNQGSKRTIVEIDGWKANLNICYDLRFPVWTKNTFNEGKYEYDIIINVANWPASRSYVWQTLLKARAIENQCYVIGVNRIGDDGFGTPHSGDSMALDPYGNEIIRATPYEEGVYSISLSKELLDDFRAKFTIGYDWDKFNIIC
jgi:predicted amidohydrolase